MGHRIIDAARDLYLVRGVLCAGRRVGGVAFVAWREKILERGEALSDTRVLDTAALTVRHRAAYKRHALVDVGFGHILARVITLVHHAERRLHLGGALLAEVAVVGRGSAVPDRVEKVR